MQPAIAAATYLGRLQSPGSRQLLPVRSAPTIAKPSHSDAIEVFQDVWQCLLRRKEKNFAARGGGPTVYGVDINQALAKSLSRG
jgi:hypothetical protein